MSHDVLEGNLEKAHEDAEIVINLKIEVNGTELRYQPSIITNADTWYEQLGEIIGYKIDEAINDEIYVQVTDVEPVDYDSLAKYKNMERENEGQ